tara:strand:+ start:1383 stop:1604 length:222 start_codon:yes stop_codon:yes gene_type:complete
LLIFIEKQNGIGIKIKKFIISVFITFQKKSLRRMAMDGNTLATIVAILHIIWVLPLGYFSVMDILESDYLNPL